jgi:putative heme-binding domain-containing protein
LTASSRGVDESLRLIEKLDQTSTAGTPSSADPGQPASADLEGWLKQLEGNADAAAGERVFFHAKGPGCYRCHEVEGRGGRVGPDLSRLARGMGRRRLVQSILQPSAEIAPQFVPWTVARTNGTVFTGILLVESQDGVQTYADTEGRSILVNSSDIEDRKPQTTSIMPDNVARTLTVQEFRDLVAFLLLP